MMMIQRATNSALRTLEFQQGEGSMSKSVIEKVQEKNLESMLRVQQKKK